MVGKIFNFELFNEAQKLSESLELCDQHPDQKELVAKL